MIGKVLLAAGLGLGVYLLYTQAGKPDKKWAPRGKKRAAIDEDPSVPKSCKVWAFQHKGHCVCLNRNYRPIRIKWPRRCTDPLPDYADTGTRRSTKRSSVRQGKR